MKIFDRFTKNNNESNMAGVGFAKMAVFTFAIAIINNVISLIVSIIAARALGPEGKGILTVVIMYPTLLYTLGHLSVYRALTVHIAAKKHSFSEFPGTVLAFVFGVSVFLIGGFVAAYFSYNKYFIQDVNFFIILAALLIIPCGIILQTFSSMLQARGRMIAFNMNSLAFNVLIFTCIAVFLGILKWGVKGGVYAYAIANIAASAVAIYLVRLESKEKWKCNWLLLKKLVFDGAKLHIGIIAYYVFLRIDMLMLEYYRQASSVGYYSIAVSIADILGLVPTTIMHVFYSRIPDLMGKENDMVRKIVLVYKHSLVLLVVTAIILGFLAKPLIILFYGKRFLPVILPFLILLPGVCFFRLNNMFSYYLVGVKKFLVISLVASLGSIMNVVLNCIFIPKYDATGAAIASVITYLIVGTAYLFAFFLISKYSFKVFLKNLVFRKEDFKLYKLAFGDIFRK